MPPVRAIPVVDLLEYVEMHKTPEPLKHVDSQVSIAFSQLQLQ